MCVSPSSRRQLKSGTLKVENRLYTVHSCSPLHRRAGPHTETGSLATGRPVIPSRPASLRGEYLLVSLAWCVTILFPKREHWYNQRWCESTENDANSIVFFHGRQAMRFIKVDVNRWSTKSCSLRHQTPFLELLMLNTRSWVSNNKKTINVGPLLIHEAVTILPYVATL